MQILPLRSAFARKITNAAVLRAKPSTAPHETGCHARTIMSLKLYWMPISQPARCVAWALEYAGVEYESVNVMPGAHDVLLRAAR
jgi:hypothetical protein